MHLYSRALGLAAAITIAFTWLAAAQTAGKGPLRTVLALGRVSSIIDAPMSFKLSRVSIPAGEAAIYRGESSMIYVLSGTPAVTVANDRRSVQQGEGIHLLRGIDVSIQAETGATAELVQYQLGRSADLAKSVMSAPASVTDLHQMS